MRVSTIFPLVREGGKDIYSEGTTVVVDRVENSRARGEVEAGRDIEAVRLVHRDEIVRSAICDRVGSGALPGRLAGVKRGHSESRGGSEGEREERGEHR